MSSDYDWEVRPAPDASIAGTHGQGSIFARESELRAWLGEPGEGDGEKVSREWVVEYKAPRYARFVPATIYDWKETSLYDEELLSPQRLRELDYVREWHVGGHEEDAARAVQYAFAAWKNGWEVRV